MSEKLDMFLIRVKCYITEKYVTHDTYFQFVGINSFQKGRNAESIFNWSKMLFRNEIGELGIKSVSLNMAW